MAWNQYLIENGWNTPRFADTHVLKSDDQYASSYSDLFFNMEIAASNQGITWLSHVTDINIINDDRYPIYFVLFEHSK